MPCRRHGKSKSVPRCAVGLVALCYHKVGTEAEEGRRLNIHPQRLESHVRYFKRRGYEFRRARDLSTNFEDGTRAVCFSFDDGFESTIANATPVFDRQGVPLSIYIVSDLVGRTSEWEGELARPLADWAALIELQSSGHEVGNHTASHPHLNRLDFSGQASQIGRCHDAMISHGLRAESFCYPYGGLNEDSQRAVAQVGYRVGLALGKRSPRASDSPIALPRIVVAYGDALPLLLYKLHLRPLLGSKGKKPVQQ